jgi:hypothetical protein
LDELVHPPLKAPAIDVLEPLESELSKYPVEVLAHMADVLGRDPPPTDGPDGQLPVG